MLWGDIFLLKLYIHQQIYFVQFWPLNNFPYYCTNENVFFRRRRLGNPIKLVAAASFRT
jgi:hypothetical protein